MNSSITTGLGTPEPTGKKVLFQPPAEAKPAVKKSPPARAAKPHPKLSSAPVKPKSSSPPRLRTTIELTRQAMEIIQDIRHQHRLRTGKVMPLWKVVSDAIEFYGKAKGRTK